MILVSDNKPSKVSDPPEGALDCISFPVAIPESVTPSIEVPVVFAMRNRKVDTSFSQTLTSRISVIRLVCDHPLRRGPWSSGASFRARDLSNNLIKESDLSRRAKHTHLTPRKQALMPCTISRGQRLSKVLQPLLIRWMCIVVFFAHARQLIGIA